jgi:hypothetical protein
MGDILRPEKALDRRAEALGFISTGLAGSGRGFLGVLVVAPGYLGWMSEKLSGKTPVETGAQLQPPVQHGKSPLFRG